MQAKFAGQDTLTRSRLKGKVCGCCNHSESTHIREVQRNDSNYAMDQALFQALEGFLIGAIPTIIFIFLLFLSYRSLVHRPLERILRERYERTEGAVARAQADIAAAAAKASEYEQRLREARQAIFKVQEARRQQLAQSRDAALREARESARRMVQEARASLELEVREAKSRLQQEAEALASEIIRTILRPVAAAPVGGRT